MPENLVTNTPFVADELIAGDHPIRGRAITLITGQNLTRGALLGKITASGKYNLSLAAAVDGSEVPVGILVKDTDATAADEVANMYLCGDINETKVVFGAGHTADSVRDGLRGLSIYLTKPAT